MKPADWIKNNTKKLTRLSDDVWTFAETALKEYRSAELLSQALQDEGFIIERKLSNMPTAFRAVWGEGSPRIGFLGEFDALADLSQNTVPYMEKFGENNSGHGCGHNLLGVGSLGAAIALRYAMEEEGKEGTVLFYGCPAEETMTGKILMSADGFFNDLDAALTWHPWYINEVMEENLLSMKTLRYGFKGVSSHAAASPEHGRSALDAVELMNVGVNYLREHVSEDVRIHYTITDGGGEPNIVPSHAQSLYFVRAARQETVEHTIERMNNIAQGAALMTGTEFAVDYISGCRNFLHNNSLEELLYECMLDTPPQEWAERDTLFAQELTKTLDKETLRTIRKKRKDDFNGNKLLHQGVAPLKKIHPHTFVSSDVANVSWASPTAQFWSCCAPLGVAHHTWQFTASAGMEIGHQGMLFAARVLAEAGMRLVSDTNLRERVRKDFRDAKDEEG